MKNDQLPANAAKMTTISDYIAMRLTERRTPVLGADMAASWGCFDLQARIRYIGDEEMGGTRHV